MLMIASRVLVSSTNDVARGEDNASTSRSTLGQEEACVVAWRILSSYRSVEGACFPKTVASQRRPSSVQGASHVHFSCGPSAQIGSSFIALLSYKIRDAHTRLTSHSLTIFFSM